MKSLGAWRRSRREAKHVATVGLLLRQAAGVYYLALHKLLAWSEAAPAGAMLPLKREGEMQLLQLKGMRQRAQAEASPSGTGGEGGEGAWWPEMESLPTLKGVGRMQQKLMRAYAADGSRCAELMGERVSACGEQPVAQQDVAQVLAHTRQQADAGMERAGCWTCVGSRWSSTTRGI